MKTERLLLADAAFLGLAGTVQMVLEVAGHFAGFGRYAAQFYQSPYTIGFFEAHGVTAVVALMLLIDRSRSNRFWHRFLLLVHLLLAGANILFWQSFITFDFIVPGIVATLLHVVFISLNGYQLTRSKLS